MEHTSGSTVSGSTVLWLVAAVLLAAACNEAPSSTAKPAAPEPRSAAALSRPVQDGAASPESRPRCEAWHPQRRAFFGDTHIHTSWSMDAYTGQTPGTPDDAYRFARGEAIAIAGGRSVQLERPLDFAAVTDHAEAIGEVALCRDPDSQVYGVEACRIFRGELASPGGRVGRMMALSDFTGEPVMVGGMPIFDELSPARAICGEDGQRCRESSLSVWEQEVAAAAAHQDAAPRCQFSTFPAYEYTLTPRLSKVHRNVIFRNDVVPPLPTTSNDGPPLHLWRRLAEECLDAGTGCDVIAIPHNSNLSNGHMFQIDYRDELPAEQRSLAELRARLESLVEIMQVKGDSECRNGLLGVVGTDEECAFEKFRPPDLEDCGDGGGQGALGGVGCISRRDFVRYALIEGLREEERIGVNPFKFGITAATDTHNATPGDTEEASYDGAHGNREAIPVQRLTATGEIVPPVLSNPGGLFGVWAEENSRESLFAAMKRRETFATSGPRIEPRFFGGWGYPKGLCDDRDLVREAYAGGVAMGGDLPTASAAAPVFVALAARDPGGGAVVTNRLERIQIVKGWVGEDGQLHQSVHDVAGEAAPAGVDPGTCVPDPVGADALCAVWSDPDFDPAVRAVYYARVLERPSCRWHTRQCLALPPAERPDGCTTDRLPAMIRERAWTSPIWYAPPSARTTS